MAHWADEFIGCKEGPLAVVRWCRLCDFHDVRRKTEGLGRGAGFRYGNQQRGRLIQHVKTAHPEKAPHKPQDAQD